MGLWFRSRIDSGIVALVAVGVITVPILGPQDMPVLRLGVGPAPFALVLPALVASGLVGVAQKGHPVYEAISGRPAGPLLAGLVLVALAVVCGLWAGLGLGTGSSAFALMAARNLAGYVGLGLAVVRMVGGVVPTASPVLYAVAVAVLGSADSSPWSWPLHRVSSVSALVAAGALLVVGLCVSVTPAALRASARRDVVA